MKRPEPLPWYSQVRMASSDAKLRPLNGKLAGIVGRAWSKGCWRYAVALRRPGNQGPCLMCGPTDFKVTGKVYPRKTFFPGESIRVSQKGEYLGPGRGARRRRT